MGGADPAEYAIRLGLWLAARQQNPYRDNTTFVACAPLDRSSSAYTIAESDVEAALVRSAELEAENGRLRAELEQLRARRMFLDGQVFISGWHAHAEACASLGRDAREAAWRKYREEMAATLAKAADAPRQPAPDTQPEPATFAQECDCDCQPGQPCLCPERDCYCGPCAVCGKTPQQRNTADGGAE